MIPGAGAPGRVAATGPHAAEDPVAPFLAVVDAPLCLALALTLAVDLVRLPRADHPVVVVAACAVMVAATAAALLVRRRPAYAGLRAWSLVVIGVGVAALTPWAMPPELRMPSLAGFWLAAGPTMVLLSSGPGRGIAAAAVAGAVSLVVPPRVTVADVALVLMLVGAGATIGWTARSVRATMRAREQDHATSAAMAERQRLARIVHDGVLQVLAMVEREGRHLGPRGSMLAGLAHEQEVQLRALIQETDIDPARRDPRDATHRNFAVVLDRHATQSVSVATPVEPLLMESHRAAELDAAVVEALSNVAKHAGPSAKAWVFLEIDGNEATVSVRDNGVGGDPARFAEAMRSGRLGMKHSIYGRIHDLGGTATLRTAPGRGVEWEFRVPIEV